MAGHKIRCYVEALIFVIGSYKIRVFRGKISGLCFGRGYGQLILRSDGF